jgi:hypothetical protein
VDEQIAGNIAEDVLRKYFAAMNVGDANAALSLFADDAVRLDTAVPKQAQVGKAQIEPGLHARVADHIHTETSEYQGIGNRASCLARVFTDYGRRLGYAPVVETVEVTIEAGKIKRFSVMVMPESLARIEEAELRQHEFD